MALRIVCWSALGLLLLMGSFEAPVEAQTSSSVVQVYLTLASPSSSRSMRVHYQSDKSTTEEIQGTISGPRWGSGSPCHHFPTPFIQLSSRA